MKFDREHVNRERRRRGLSPLPERPGRPRGPRPKVDELRKLYVVKGLSLRATADTLGITKDMAARTLKEAGIKRRPNVNPPRLRGQKALAAVLNARYPGGKYSDTKRAWPEVGRQFGVSARTIRRFVFSITRDAAKTPRGLNESAARAWEYWKQYGRKI